MSIQDKLAYLKKERRLTNEAISRLSGVPLGTVNKICAGQTRKPSLQTMERICQVFHVSLHYLLDDEIPPERSISAHTAGQDFCALSDTEYANLEKYRRLTEHGRRSIDMLLDSLDNRAQPLADGRPAKNLLCYVPVSQGQAATLCESFLLKPMLAALDALSAGADFTVQVTSTSLEPAYRRGSILLMKSGAARHGQLGMFLVNREALLRRYHASRGVRKLTAVNVDIRDITIRPEDDFRCLGVVLGEAQGWRWI